MKLVSFLVCLVGATCVKNVAAQDFIPIRSFTTSDSVRVTIDLPDDFSPRQPTTLCFFALPNGNSTEQTMGRRMNPGDDWHFDIQHIRAQTLFIRQRLAGKNFVVVYLENNLRSWPAWKQRHPGFRLRLPFLLDSLRGLIPGKKPVVYLNGHSGGGSLIFGFLAGVKKIPRYVQRISFLDSDYGYDSTYDRKLRHWLRKRGHCLNVFAYNDSVALLDGKSFVSATGGTWYRSWLMLRHLQTGFRLERLSEDSIIHFSSGDGRIQFFFRTNPERKIYHTVQVERNGFIHSVFCGRPLDSKGYRYYGPRAYADLVESELKIVLESR